MFINLNLCQTNEGFYTILPQNISLGEFQGDIAIPNQEEIENYRKELLEGLQVEEEGLTDYIRKKSKQDPTLDSPSFNDPADNTALFKSGKTGQDLKSTSFTRISNQTNFWKSKQIQNPKKNVTKFGTETIVVDPAKVKMDENR